MTHMPRLTPVLIMTILAVSGCSGDEDEYAPAEPTFDGNSTQLSNTEIVATLDAPMPPGKNVIWCGSFLAAWKTLEDDLAKEPPALEGNPPIVAALNKAVDPRPAIPPDCLYTAAGWVDKGIIQQITADLCERFPSKAAPTFPGIAPDSFLAYAYLQANAKFAIPYFKANEPLVFTDSNGQQTKLKSFGLRSEDYDAYMALRGQPKILSMEYARVDHRLKLKSIAIDLDRTSSPNQIVIAMIPPKATLAETLADLEDRISQEQYDMHGDDLGPSDVLLIPEIAWRIKHEFAELQGQQFTNDTMKRQPIHIARQDIEFRLDRSGAELASEAKVHYQGIGSPCLFDRPFLIYMKQRGADMPYFVMWVDNAELLARWQGDG